MARKRTVFETQEEQDRAYALNVAAAMAASEESDATAVVHTPSVKKKSKKLQSATSSAASVVVANGVQHHNHHHTHATPLVKKKTPVKKSAAPATPVRAATTPSKATTPSYKTPVKKSSALASASVKREPRPPPPPVVKYERPRYEEQEKADSEYESAEEDEPIAREEEEEIDEEEDEDDDEEEEIAAPVVFQCGTCRSIFGDSYAFVCSNAELLLVTLSAVTNISLSPEAHTSRDTADRGSSFHELLCKQCQTVLGRQYLTTTRALDGIRSLYSFSTSAIASYQLGYPQLSQVENGTSDTLPTMEQIKNANQKCDEAVQVLSLDRQALLKLRDDMSKVQSLLVVVDERLHQLETQAEDSEQEQEQEPEQEQHAEQEEEEVDDEVAVDPLGRRTKLVAVPKVVRQAASMNSSVEQRTPKRAKGNWSPPY